jgi:hypothetical protein
MHTQAFRRSFHQILIAISRPVDDNRIDLDDIGQKDVNIIFDNIFVSLCCCLSTMMFNGSCPSIMMFEINTVLA